MESLRVLIFLLGLAALAPLPASTQNDSTTDITSTTTSEAPVTTTAITSTTTSEAPVTTTAITPTTTSEAPATTTAITSTTTSEAPVTTTAITSTTTTTRAPVTTTATVPPQETTMGPSACPDSYYEVGDRCLLVNPFLEGTWDEARYYCRTLGSEFVEIETFQFFLDLLNFLRDESLDEHSYWLGARDEAVEGEWRWELGGGILPMGSPFWALDFYSGDTYNIEPLGQNYSNCLRLDHMRYLYLDDMDCTSPNSFMCQQLP